MIQLRTKTQQLGGGKWRQLLWTDESQFKMFGCRGRRSVHSVHNWTCAVNSSISEIIFTFELFFPFLVITFRRVCPPSCDGTLCPRLRCKRTIHHGWFSWLVGFTYYCFRKVAKRWQRSLPGASEGIQECCEFFRSGSVEEGRLSFYVRLLFLCTSSFSWGDKKRLQKNSYMMHHVLYLGSG